MSTRPYRATIISADRVLLRRLARFLGAFGYRVTAAAEPDQVRTLHGVGLCDLLVVDGEFELLQACQPLLADAAAQPIYVLQLADDAGPQRILESLRMGVSDILAKPVVFGELLARLRAGVRFLEYERRVRQRAAVCPVTSLLTEAAFRERLALTLDASSTGNAVHCLRIAIDFLDVFATAYGRHTVAKIEQAAVLQLQNHLGAGQFLARLGRGQFAALVSEPSEVKTLAWAEALRTAVAEVRLPDADTGQSLTASFGLAEAGGEASTAQQLLERAALALESAIASGGNCVARAGQFDEETRTWENLARAGRLFENTTARDLMLVVPRIIQGDADARHAIELLDNTGVEDLPVVDAQGRFIGLIRGAELPDSRSRSGWRATASDIMSNDLPVVAEETPFHLLMDQFMDVQMPYDVIVVTRMDQPVGLVYRTVMADLSSPLDTASFAPTGELFNNVHALAVPDVVATAATN